MGTGYCIPYFNAKRTSIPFAQVRHLSGDRRFTFLPKAEVTAYGRWNVTPGARLFVVEGASDAAVMEYAMVPWVAMPSASSGRILDGLATYCWKKKIELIYAGDNDSAGDNLKFILDDMYPYRVKQPPKDYKDWGEFMEEKGIEAVQSYCMPELEVPRELSQEEAVAANIFGMDKGQKRLL